LHEYFTSKDLEQAGYWCGDHFGGFPNAAAACLICRCTGKRIFGWASNHLDRGDCSLAAFGGLSGL